MQVYPSASTVNERLLGVATKAMGVSEEVAVEKLQAKLMLPVRKPAKGMALVVAYQYIKRVFGHLNSSLSSVCVSTFVKRTHALKGIGTWSTPSASSTRRVLKQSPEECTDLLRADSFIRDAHGRLAMLDVLANVIEELEATAMMVSWTGPNKATRVIRCLFGHVANVTFRVCSWVHSRLRALARMHLWSRCTRAPRSLSPLPRHVLVVLRQLLTLYISLCVFVPGFRLTPACVVPYYVCPAPSQVRSYLRNRAGLPSLLAGAGVSALNQGHHALFQRELLLLHDILPMDSEVHDGLQLIDGGDPRRHLGEEAPSVPAPPLQPVAAPATPLPAVLGAAPAGVLLPLPQQPMRLEALPAHVVGRGALPAPNGHGSLTPREGELVDYADDEEEDEIRPVRDERAAQWRAYRAAGF